jgi:hypothetical protein
LAGEEEVLRHVRPTIFVGLTDIGAYHLCQRFSLALTLSGDMLCSRRDHPRTESCCARLARLEPGRAGGPRWRLVEHRARLRKGATRADPEQPRSPTARLRGRRASVGIFR